MMQLSKSKYKFFADLIRNIEIEAQNSELATNIACDRVNKIRSERV